jgi:hypothetical protein
MSPKRLFFSFLGLLLLLLVGLVAGAYGTNSLLTTQANKLTNLKAEGMALSQEQLGLNKAKEEVKKYSDLEQITQTIVPEDKNQAEAVREIVNIANQNGVSLAAINFPASTLGTSTVASSSSTSSSASASAAADAANSIANSADSPLNSLSQLTAVPKIPGVYQLQITVEGDSNKPVAYGAFLNFLTALEHNRRTAQVSAISIAPSTNDTSLFTFTLTLNEYIKP